MKQHLATAKNFVTSHKLELALATAVITSSVMLVVTWTNLDLVDEDGKFLDENDDLSIES